MFVSTESDLLADRDVNQVSGTGLLDVYGAGTAAGSRGVKLWDNVTVPGTVGITGAATLGGGATVSGNNLIVNTAIGTWSWTSSSASTKSMGSLYIWIT